MPKRYLTGGGKSLKKQEKSINYAIKTSKTTKYFLQQFIEKIANLYPKLRFLAYDKIEGEGPSAQIIYQICVDNLNELNPNNLKEAPRAQRKSENKDNHDKGAHAHLFCLAFYQTEILFQIKVAVRKFLRAINISHSNRHTALMLSQRAFLSRT